MVVRLWSIAHWGLEALGVEIEVDVSNRGLPGLTIVGLAGKATEEAKERVRLAISNSGFEFPNKKIVVNLAPADLPKEGSAFDLPIAVGILAAAKLIDPKLISQNEIYYGELSLDGQLRHTKGVLAAGLGAIKLKKPRLFVPRLSASQAAVIESLSVYPVTGLAELIRHWRGQGRIKPLLAGNCPDEPTAVELDLAEVAGQLQAKRAVEITAAGGHHLLLSGPPGSGKTMLARCLPGILPGLSLNERLVVTQIHSLAGLIGAGEALIKVRPFRSPHHSVSLVGLVGGGNVPRPGEVSLAHSGVLFLDEMAEFPRSCLEGLRQPLEDGQVGLVRAAGRVVFPSRFSLVGAVNPCPCGFRGHPTIACQCSPRAIDRYRQKLSGPILDRIDLKVWVPSVEGLAPLRSPPGERSTVVRARVEASRRRQVGRLAKFGKLTNSEMNNKEIKATCPLDIEGESLLGQAANHYHLSSRGLIRLVKVSRTIADLEGCEQIKTAHIAEAIQYRLPQTEEN